MGHLIDQCDIFALSETWLKSTDFTINGFKTENLIRENLHKNAKRGSGGLSLFIKDNIHSQCSV